MPEISKEDCSASDSEPMLGNARTISESRDTIRQWTRSFTSLPPENDDIAEVSKSVITKSHIFKYYDIKTLLDVV